MERTHIIECDFPEVGKIVNADVAQLALDMVTRKNCFKGVLAQKSAEYDLSKRKTVLKSIIFGVF